jgi:glycosyltransferase involved in cell wall biosynthesis
MISVLILTRNEERNLPSCLASVAWSDDIHVLDSMSTDNTAAIATASGAKVTQRAFDNWSSHQNWALQNLPFRHPWVFYLDADELATLELRDAMQQAVASPGDAVAFSIQRRDYFRGDWLKHVQASPFYLRLFRPEKMRYERLVNPVSVPDGPTGQIAGCIDHFPFSKGIGDWLARHNQYSQLEAEQIVQNRAAKPKLSLKSALFDTDFHRRRYHQKELFYRLPARPLAKFFALYIAKRGFLDGRAGFTYATLQAIYEYMIVLKTRELERAGIRCNC